MSLTDRLGAAILANDSIALQEIVQTFPTGVQTHQEAYTEALCSLAASARPLSCLDVLLGELADDVNRANAQGRTSLHLAAFHGQLRVVQRLVQCKSIDVNKCTPRGCSAAYFAAYRGHTSILKRLLEAGAAPDAATQDTGSTPLIVAALKGHHDCLNVLLQYKADVHHRNVHGMTAMHAAASAGHTAIVDYLKRQGADPLARDNFGQTPEDIRNKRRSQDLSNGVVSMPPQSFFVAPRPPIMGGSEPPPLPQLDKPVGFVPAEEPRDPPHQAKDGAGGGATTAAILDKLDTSSTKSSLSPPLLVLPSSSRPTASPTASISST